MGAYFKGILGPFTGLVGTVVGSIWKGKQVMRSRPVISNKTPSDLQLEQRSRFALVVKFLKPISGIIRIGYQQYNSKETPMNAAVSYHLDQVVTGIYPALMIDYLKVRIATGSLPGLYLPTVATTAGANLLYEWEDTVLEAGAAATDRLTIVVYNPTKTRFVLATSIAARSALSYTMALPADFSGDALHSYLFLVSTDGRKVSDSVHLGPITLP